jgi:acyl-CoA synthetase (AMP-forming)/AMP-acid ligase II
MPMYNTIRALLDNKDRCFVPSGPSVGEIGILAEGIRDTFSRLGAPTDEPVCLCLQDRSFLLAALLASLAGAPPFILPHAFHRQVLRETYEARPFRLILADTAIDPPETGSRNHLPLKWVRPPDQPFVSLFTGGSTGTPRIWSKTPGNLFGEALHLAKTFDIRPSDLLLPTVPPQHIYGLLYSVLLPFVAPAKVLRDTGTFPREILSALQTEGATVLVSAPIHYRALKNGDLRRFSLRLALSSTAPLDVDDAAFDGDGGNGDPRLRGKSRLLGAILLPRLEDPL